MYNLKRNKGTLKKVPSEFKQTPYYHQNPKNSTIYTPLAASQFIFELLEDRIKKFGRVFDPCCGQGNLLEPWKESVFITYGMDIEQNSSADAVQNFLTWDGTKVFKFNEKPDLILCNPPFNGYDNKLGSEVWLDKIIELFGKEVPIVLFAPSGFRLNLTLKSKRWEKLRNGIYPPICSIISLPKNLFPGVVFHSEILIFNIKGLKAHYFYEPTT